MADTGATNPGTAGEDNTTGYTTWYNNDNCKIEDGNYAYAQIWSP